jgi:hypothetical protein
MEFGSWAKKLSEKADKLGLGFKWHNLQRKKCKDKRKLFNFDTVILEGRLT